MTEFSQLLAGGTLRLFTSEIFKNPICGIIGPIRLTYIFCLLWIRTHGTLIVYYASSKLAVCALARQGRAITDKMLIVFKMRMMVIVIFFLVLVKLLQG